MHANAHGVCTDTVRESALKLDSGRKIPCRTGESNLRQRCAGPMLYQLSYIPTHPVGWGSIAAGFPVAWLGCVTFLACCGESSVVSVFGQGL